MTAGDWEVGFKGQSLEELLNGDDAAQTLWFLAGYLKGMSDGSEMHAGVRQMLFEVTGENSWRLQSKAITEDARR